jgi:hypothetical protein
MNCGLEIMDLRTGIFVKKICISETNIFYAWFVQTELLSKAFAQI